ncbi:DUF4340 domain-containing protein [Hahella sp. SMD15-11]|uniref:DUF4340 domain-containing protein n=1 Tax=Thermohahella caldifontis TaxID=3142973 RepID=A0AB39USN3_9GAMM
MKRWISWLSVLLGVQVLLSAALLWSGQKASFNQVEPLFASPLAEADKIVIHDEDGNEVTLVRDGETWKLPDLYDLKADQSKLRKALETLSGLKRGWPVARTETSHERFKVTDKVHVRKITFYKGDSPWQTVYLGTSPAFKRIHLRKDGETEVYAVDFAAYELPAKASDWLDTRVAAVDTDALSRIEGPDFALVRDGDQWKLEKVPEGKVQDDKGVESLLDDLKTLSILDVLGKAPEPEYGLDSPVVNWTLTPRSGAPFTLRLGKHKDGWYALQRSDMPLVYKVAAYVGDKLAAMGIGPLTKAAPAQDTEPARRSETEQ